MEEASKKVGAADSCVLEGGAGDGDRRAVLQAANRFRILLLFEESDMSENVALRGIGRVSMDGELNGAEPPGLRV